MKKVLAALLVMLMCMTAVFAATTTLIMDANVADGSGISGPSTDQGGDTPVDPEEPVVSNPNIYIYYALAGDESVSVGSSTTAITTNMKSLSKNAQPEEKFDLVGSDDNSYDNVYLYVYAAAKTASAKSATVTFSCADGWEFKGTLLDTSTAPKIPLSFSPSVADASNGLSAKKEDTAAASEGTSSSAKFTVSAAAGSNVSNAFLIGKSAVSWTQSADYLAGDYQAVITVTVETAA